MIAIIPYRTSWPGEFAAIGALLRSALGELAPRIDHIGSTSVPGLAAKDVIDMQITVRALDDERIMAALAALGYVRSRGIGRDHRPPAAGGPDDDWQKLLYTQPPGQRRANVHIRIQGRPNQRYPLLFRDYLRAHPDAAEAYARLKLGLASILSDTGTYADIKDPACDLIFLAAEDWASATGWQPGPTDA